MRRNSLELRVSGARQYVRAMARRSGATERLSATIEMVVSRFRALVCSIGARRGLVDADLDEVLQDVRIRLWQAEESGKVLDELGSSYLYHLANTATLDLMRRRRAYGATQSEDVDDRTDLRASSSPVDDLESSELGAQIEAALETLSLDRRVAVRFHLSGYDRHDVARMLGWTEARARNLIYRGLEDLRQRLIEAGFEPRRAG